MTNYKTASSLSIAVLAFLATAAPSFSQSQSNHAVIDKQNLQTIVIEQTLASNWEKTVPANTRFATPAPTKKPVTLSASNFEVKSQIMAPASQFNFNPATLSDASDRNQLKSSNQDEATSAKQVTFVPSRGLKLPE